MDHLLKASNAQIEKVGAATKLSFSEAAHLLITGYPYPIVYIEDTSQRNAKWWKFNGKNWEELNQTILEQFMTENGLPRHNSTISNRREVLRHAGLMTLKTDTMTPRVGALSLENGTLDIDFTTGLHEFHEGVWRQEDWQTQTLPLVYDPKSRCPRFDRFLHRMQPNPEVRNLLAEYAGYTLVPDQRFQKFILLYGVGHNGKSVFMDILNILHGKGSKAISMDHLNGKFSLADCINKSLFIDGDILGSTVNKSDSRAMTGMIKRITGGDPVRIEPKYGTDYSAMLTGKFVFSANVKPRFHDPSQGLWRRLIPIPWEVVISEDDPDFINELGKNLSPVEMSGIFNWILAGLRDLINRGKFNLPNAIRMEIREYQDSSDPVREFMDEFCVQGEDTDMVSIATMLKLFKQFCIINGYSDKMGRSYFIERVRAVSYPVKRPYLIEEGRKPSRLNWHILKIRLTGKGESMQSRMGFGDINDFPRDHEISQISTDKFSIKPNYPTGNMHMAKTQFSQHGSTNFHAGFPFAYQRAQNGVVPVPPPPLDHVATESTATNSMPSNQAGIMGVGPSNHPHPPPPFPGAVQRPLSDPPNGRQDQ